MEKIKLKNLENICGGFIVSRIVYFIDGEVVDDLDDFFREYNKYVAEHKKSGYGNLVKKVVYDIYSDDSIWDIGESKLLYSSIEDLQVAEGIDRSVNDYGFISHSH